MSSRLYSYTADTRSGTIVLGRGSVFWYQKRMALISDIRVKPCLSHEDIAGLNFIRSETGYVFRQHYREGLRSHIMEVLRAEDVQRETRGVVADGVTVFPRARPVKMLRLFRRQFADPREVFDEIRRFKLVAACLGRELIAHSNEFIVAYIFDGRRHVMLCGLQEFVDGEIFDPWLPMTVAGLRRLLQAMNAGREDGEEIVARAVSRARVQAARLTAGARRLIREAGMVPDLSGVGNLILMRDGSLKLVDINNICDVGDKEEIPLDDYGYPSADKAVEVITLLERHLLGRAPDHADPVLGRFLSPKRMRRVRRLARRCRFTNYPG